jgi:predicted  nucleic acid-binding Zn-ribbon protein
VRVHPDIANLLQVQAVDQKLARIRRDLASLPAEATRRRQRLEQVRQEGEQAAAALLAAEVEYRSQEKNILGADEELKKLQARLSVVKNNAEYQATLFQMESVKRERSASEDEALQLMERVEVLRRQAAEAREKLAAEEATFAEFTREAEKLRAEREAELASVGAGRDALTKDVPPDLLKKYTDLFHVRDGEAVCGVEGDVCTGCYTRVTPNDQTRLLGSTSIVTCGACQRLLYLKER